MLPLESGVTLLLCRPFISLGFPHGLYASRLSSASRGVPVLLSQVQTAIQLFVCHRTGTSRHEWILDTFSTFSVVSFEDQHCSSAKEQHRARQSRLTVLQSAAWAFSLGISRLFLSCSPARRGTVRGCLFSLFLLFGTILGSGSHPF